jgi:hypothetical protein
MMDFIKDVLIIFECVEYKLVSLDHCLIRVSSLLRSIYNLRILNYVISYYILSLFNPVQLV